MVVLWGCCLVFDFGLLVVWFVFGGCWIRFDVGVVVLMGGVGYVVYCCIGLRMGCEFAGCVMGLYWLCVVGLLVLHVLDLWVVVLSW